MLIESWLYAVYFSIGIGSSEILDVDVGTSGPSKMDDHYSYGWSLQVISISVRNFQYQKRMCGDGCVEMKVKCIPSVLVRLKI
jgi:hypothetical protein